MQFLADYDAPTLAADLEVAGFKASHAKGILRTFYATHGAPAFPERTFGRKLCDWLENQTCPMASRVVHRTVAGDGTTKLLVGFPGGAAVECVLMPTHRLNRAMACVSSQVGCAMGCDFCASTRHGLERNLTSGEIVEQFLHLRAEAASIGRRITSIVFMGMGEPMHNLDEVLPAVRRITGNGMGGLGGRKVTISTVGVVPGIDRLADADLNVHLAVSLHAPDDETRGRIVPANRRYRVAEVIAAARRFYARTGRIVTIEYCLLAGVNDSDAHANALVALLAAFRAHVNLIPYNAIGAGMSNTVYARPSRERMDRFIGLLRDAGTVAHFRHTRGDDANAACGQLRETVVQMGASVQR